MTVKLKRPLKPGSISHYTTLEGLQGIVQSGCLWASNAAFLNDKAELNHALRASKEAIEKLSSQKALKRWESSLAQVFRELEDGGIPDTYVACFCRNDDNLSQWRGYGGQTQGISLTFDRSLLAKRLRKENASFHQVLYSKYSTARKLSDALKTQIEEFADLEKVLGSQDKQRQYAELFTMVSALLPRFKHLGFSDEKEWRFIIQRNVEKSDLCFRVSNSKIIPYIKVGHQENGDARLPLTAVRIGPGPDQELTRLSVRTFLLAHDYGDVEIDVSQIPFRDYRVLQS